MLDQVLYVTYNIHRMYCTMNFPVEFYTMDSVQICVTLEATVNYFADIPSGIDRRSNCVW